MLILLALASCLPCLPHTDDVAALRAEGPPALARLLERYRSQAPGPAHDALEATIDAVAAQRYATVSGLYWYTDLAQAEEAAHASGRPILSLRMLGRLDEDLSCANSRFFRVALYANATASQFLRENFVLHWSSERPVPKVTIDFGDGRSIQTTLAGNSAHYVLDADGRVIDVLPGLYSPVAFERELEALLPLARTSPTLDAAERLRRVRELQLEHDNGLESTWGPNVAATGVELPAPGAILPAELITRGKCMAEAPVLSATALAGRADGFGSRRVRLAVRRVDEARLDASSRALFTRLVPEGEVEWQLWSFESALAADTELNESQVRRQIHYCFQSADGLPTFEDLNERIYRDVFRMPREDPWLGLHTPQVFNGLPNAGLSR